MPWDEAKSSDIDRSLSPTSAVAVKPLPRPMPEHLGLRYRKKDRSQLMCPLNMQSATKVSDLKPFRKSRAEAMSQDRTADGDSRTKSPAASSSPSHSSVRYE